MTEKTQESGAKRLQYNGFLANLTGEKLTIVNDGPARAWPSFPPDEDVAPVVPAVRLLEGEELPDEELKKILLPTTVGLDGEMEEAGSLNTVFRLVRPVQDYDELKRLCKEKLEEYGPRIVVPKTPSVANIRKWTRCEQYYIMRADAVCLSMLKHYVRREELEHWLIPVEPVTTENLGVIGYKAFMPAHFLFPEEQ